MKRCEFGDWSGALGGRVARAALALATVGGAVAHGADEPAAGIAAAAATTTTANPAAGTPAYWQVPPLPNAVIQGGAIPPGWQPQAVPYQGVGPDGRPVTMYFAPTYVFTYQSGPPMPAVPQVNRGAWAAPPASAGWNYATTGAAPVATSLTPGTLTRYRPAYQFPDDARALQGSALVPPGPLPASQPPVADSAWGGAGAPVPNTLAPPPTQWVPAAPQAVAQPSAPQSPPGDWAAPAAIGGATAAAMQPSPAPVAAPAPCAAGAADPARSSADRAGGPPHLARGRRVRRRHGHLPR